MKKATPKITIKPDSYVSKILGHSLSRFIIAGFFAFFIAFALLFFMRYLILGYDKFTSEEITRYLSIKTLTSTRGKFELTPIERPIKPSYRPGINDSDFQQTLEASTDQGDIQIPVAEAISHQIEDDIQLPALEHSSLSTQEKMKLIKQELLSEDD